MKNKTEENQEAYLGQSFDHPFDAFLLSIKLGWDLRIGLHKHLTTWKIHDDPSC